MIEHAETDSPVLNATTTSTIPGLRGLNPAPSNDLEPQTTIVTTQEKAEILPDVPTRKEKK